MAAEYPDEIWFGYIINAPKQREDYVEVPPAEFRVYRKDQCEVNNYKYIIVMDGQISPWGRGPQILY